MNKRAMKKAEKNKRCKFVELFDLALQANGLENRTKEKTGDLPTVFFSFSGHVSWITVQVYPDGWECYAPHKEALVCTGQIFSERDYQEAKELLMQAIEKAGK